MLISLGRALSSVYTELSPGDLHPDDHTMGILGALFFPWGIILQALAILHFIRRRPDTYWLFVILFLGPLGALIYLLVEAAPDLNFLSRQSARGFSRRKRIRELEALTQF